MATRRTAATIAGSREAVAIAVTLGGQVRVARRRRHLTLRVLVGHVGISVTRLSEIERGPGVRAPLETRVALGVALDRPLAVTMSRLLDAPSDRAAGHLDIQEAVLALARVRALTDPDARPPNAPGIVWFDAATGRLAERRGARMTP